MSATIVSIIAVLVSALAGGIAAFKLKLPMIVGYITAGVVVGNLVSGYLDRDIIQIIADSGVTLLLFTLGVEFSFHRLRKMLGTLLWPVLVQISVVALVFLAIFMAMGMTFPAAFVFAIAVSLSSTAVVIRILSERGELETVHGELLTTWLIIQDLSVIPIMMIMPTVMHPASADTGITQSIMSVVINMAKSGALIAAVFVLGRTVTPKLLNAVATLGSREIFLISVVGMVFLTGMVFTSFGLSAALGAFIAGLVVADTSQNHEIFSEVRPLRDLFSVVFFVSIGLMLPVADLVPSLPYLAVLLPLMAGGKALLVYLLCRFLGYHRKTSFIAGLGLVQMSEFGFILAHEGVQRGALTASQNTFLVALAFASIIMGSIVLPKAQDLYYFLFRKLGSKIPVLFRFKPEQSMLHEQLDIRDHVVICGYGRVGRYIGRALEMANIPFIVIEFNHTTVKKLRGRGVPVFYGDPADIDVLDCAQVDLARAVVIAIPDRHTQEMVIGNSLTLNKTVRIICRSHHEEDQRRLKSLGVATIIQPEFEAALSVINRLLPDYGVAPDELSGKISRLKIEHGLG